MTPTRLITLTIIALIVWHYADTDVLQACAGNQQCLAETL